MNAEKVLEIAQYFTPLEMTIIRLVADGAKAEKIAQETGLRKEAVQRRILIIGKRLKEAYTNV